MLTHLTQLTIPAPPGPQPSGKTETESPVLVSQETSCHSKIDQWHKYRDDTNIDKHITKLGGYVYSKGVTQNQEVEEGLGAERAQNGQREGEKYQQGCGE